MSEPRQAAEARQAAAASRLQEEQELDVPGFVDQLSERVVGHLLKWDGEVSVEELVDLVRAAVDGVSARLFPRSTRR